MIRTGIKRIREAGALYRGALDAYDSHTRGCARCHIARRDSLPMSFCDTGWELAKVATGAYHALERARGRTSVREHGEQLSLF